MRNMSGNKRNMTTKITVKSKTPNCQNKKWSRLQRSSGPGLKSMSFISGRTVYGMLILVSIRTPPNLLILAIL